MSDSKFEPRIVGFLCHWCTYTGADLAGTTRQQYPAGIRIIHLMCSGAIDVVYVLKSLLDGADGVLIGGCHPGDCHYQTGNLKARRRIALLRSVMERKPSSSSVPIPTVILALANPPATNVELTCRPPKNGTSNQFYVKPHNFPGQVQRIVIKRYRLNSCFQGFTDSLRIF